MSTVRHKTIMLYHQTAVRMTQIQSTGQLANGRMEQQ